MAVLKGGTYAKKGKETSHRNPKAGHMQKKARKPPTEIRKQDICKKGEGTSHRNPKAGHMQKKGEGTSHSAFCTLWRSQMRFRAVALRSITAARF